MVRSVGNKEESRPVEENQVRVEVRCHNRIWRSLFPQNAPLNNVKQALQAAFGQIVNVVNFSQSRINDGHFMEVGVIYNNNVLLNQLVREVNGIVVLGLVTPTLEPVSEEDIQAIPPGEYGAHFN